MGQEREKKILVPNSILARFGNENSEKYSKKIPKIKKHFSALFLTKTGWDRQRKWKKVFTKTGWDRQRKWKKVFLPNYVLTQPDLENSKKYSKKIQKIKKLNSGHISTQNWLKEAGKERKKFQSQIPFLHEPCFHFPNKIAKKFKKLKNIIPTLVQYKPGWDWLRKREKNLSPDFRSYSTRARKFQKNRKKNQKIKNLFPALFVGKTGWDRPRKREKNFSPEFHSYSTQEENSD